MSTAGDGKLFGALLASVRNQTIEAFLTEHTPDEVLRLLHDWQIWGRADQLPPGVEPLGARIAAAMAAFADNTVTDDVIAHMSGIAAPNLESATGSNGITGPDYRTWLLLGGRGSGKTRAGAEWVRAQALGIAPFADRVVERIALVGETLADVRSVMVEGVSGLLAIHPPHERPKYEPSQRRLRWPNGSIAQLFSAENPDGLRGPQFGAAWCDEIAKWRYADKTWDMLQFALRLGEAPRQVVTTTPRPIALLKRILADATTAVSRSRTLDNFANLAPGFIQDMRARYGSGTLGRQELDGEIVEDRADGLWRRADIESARVPMAQDLRRIVVAIDPPVTSGAKADACGIVVAGVGGDGRGFVLADRTLAGQQASVWARAAVRALHEFGADRIVAEVNQGGDLVEEMIRQVEPSVPVRKVRATRGKWVRAEPVAALYERGLISHVGTFAALEDQMCAFGPDGLPGGRSPDRMDALVWALTDLMLTKSGEPRIRVA